MSAIGHRIRALRKTNVDLNQTQLGAAVGVDQSVISDIERGAGFGADVLIGLADALNTTPHFIMRGGTDEAAQEAHLLGLFRACKPSDKLLLMETARAFADRPGKRVETDKLVSKPLPSAQKPGKARQH